MCIADCFASCGSSFPRYRFVDRHGRTEVITRVMALVVRAEDDINSLAGVAGDHRQRCSHHLCRCGDVPSSPFEPVENGIDNDATVMFRSHCRDRNGAQSAWTASLDAPEAIGDVAKSLGCDSFIRHSAIARYGF